MKFVIIMLMKIPLVILPNGKEMDGVKNYQKPDFYAERPEVKSALSGEYGKHTRYNIGLKETFIHIAIPIKDNDDSILCAVRGLFLLLKEIYL